MVLVRNLPDYQLVNFDLPYVLSGRALSRSVRRYRICSKVIVEAGFSTRTRRPIAHDNATKSAVTCARSECQEEMQDDAGSIVLQQTSVEESRSMRVKGFGQIRALARRRSC